MKYNIPTIPKEVAKIIKDYQFIAINQGSTESSILYWILSDHIQDNNYYTSTTHWLENNIADLAIAVQTGRWIVE